MSVSCVGTCSNCGVQRFWLSDTLSIQLDDGQLKCLPHPAESEMCEEEGLTISQASARGRLYREKFYVCLNCGRGGEIISREPRWEWERMPTLSGSMKWGWGLAVILVPMLAWMGWWGGAFTFGATLITSPGIVWWEDRKNNRLLGGRGFPRSDAPGRCAIPAPASGCHPEFIVGRFVRDERRHRQAAGPCCDRPVWIEAFRVKDEDRVPCYACGNGVMTVSEHAIH
jgi:hypothetical protein